MKELIFGVSGVRGIVGESLTSEVANKLGRAFGTFVYRTMKKPSSKARGLKVVIGKDGRSSGKSLKRAFAKGMIFAGCDMIDMGEIATPVLLYNIRKTKGRGAVVITASHNPPEWNGFKFATSRGMFVNADEVEEIRDIFETESYIKGLGGKLLSDTNGEKRHIIAVVDLLDRDIIRERELKVVIDSPWFTEIANLLRGLGCEVSEITSKRGFEPEPENLTDLSAAVTSEGADIGFATDADGDRLGIVTEEGNALDPEYTLPLVADWVLKRRMGLVVTNLSTSKMTQDIVARHGSRLRRTKVGEINVVEGMLEKGAILAGEGNGGIIDPFLHYTRDSFIGMCRILEAIAGSGKSIGELASRIPKYYMVKKKIEDPDSTIKDFEFLSKLFRRSKTNTEDGLRIDFDKGWVHVRRSNTEHIIRVICETKDKSTTDSVVHDVLNRISKAQQN
jgi:phosphomannomutase